MTEQTEREVLEALWARLHDGKDAYWCEWYASDGKNHEARYFLKKLDAEAYVDAALMLVPEGWSWQVSANPNISYATIVDPAMVDELDTGKMFSGCGPTPALALAAAIQRTGDGADR